MSSQAVRFDADADKYTLASAGFGGVGQDYTVCLWVYLSVSRGYYQIPWSCVGGGSYVQFGVNYDGVLLRAMGNGTAGINGLNPMPIATWMFVAISHDAATDTETLYWAEQDDVALSSAAGDLPDANAASTVYLGGNAATDEWVNGRVCAVKMWHAALDEAELEAELLAYNPSRTDDLFARYTFWDGPQTADNSGHGHTLTAGASPTAEAGPPGLPLDVPPGTFKVGRIRDDANGADTIDITTDGFTELEWNLQIVPPAVGEDVYEFRVYAGATPLDVYTVTPRLQVTSETAWTRFGETIVRSAYYGAVPVVPFGVRMEVSA